MLYFELRFDSKSNNLSYQKESKEMLSKEHFHYNIHKSPMKNSAYPPLINSPPYMDYLPYFYKRTLSPHPFMSRGLTL